MDGSLLLTRILDWIRSGKTVHTSRLICYFIMQINLVTIQFATLVLPPKGEVIDPLSSFVLRRSFGRTSRVITEEVVYFEKNVVGLDEERTRLFVLLTDSFSELLPTASPLLAFQ